MRTIRGTKAQVSKMLAKAIVNALDLCNAEIKGSANTILAQAKANAPVKTGTLRDSGKVEIENKFPTEYGIYGRVRAHVRFTAPYAKKVEKMKGAPTVAGGLYVQNVRSFKRKTKRTSNTVRAHKRVYVNQRPMEISPGVWRVVSANTMSNTSSKSFLRPAVNKVIGARGRMLLARAVNRVAGKI